MKKLSLLPILVLFIISCAAPPPLTIEQQAVMDHPLTFDVPKADSDEAWLRAQAFIAKYATMKIQTTTEVLVETYAPTNERDRYGYKVTRMPGADADEFDVICVAGYGIDKFAKYNVKNAHVLAHYITTGEIEKSLLYPKE